MAQTWAEAKKAVPDAPFGEGKDGQALTDAFEEFVGGRSRAGRLERLRRAAAEGTRRSGLDLLMRGPADPDKVFAEKAEREGFTSEQVKAAIDVVV